MRLSKLYEVICSKWSAKDTSTAAFWRKTIQMFRWR